MKVVVIPSGSYPVWQCDHVDQESIYNGFLNFWYVHDGEERVRSFNVDKVDMYEVAYDD